MELVDDHAVRRAIRELSATRERGGAVQRARERQGHRDRPDDAADVEPGRVSLPRAARGRDRRAHRASRWGIAPCRAAFRQTGACTGTLNVAKYACNAQRDLVVRLHETRLTWLDDLP